jgi:hypothetical protein
MRKRFFGMATAFSSAKSTACRSLNSFECGGPDAVTVVCAATFEAWRAERVSAERIQAVAAHHRLGDAHRLGRAFTLDRGFPGHLHAVAGNRLAASSFMRPRSRLPTGTGAVKRTLFSP